MGNKKYAGIVKCLGLFALAFVLGTAGWAGEPRTLKISQAHAAVPEIIVYADILDGSGAPAEGLLESHFSATLGPHQAKIKKLGLFNKDAEGTAYIVLVDISTSLKEAEFQQIRQSLTIWIENLSGRDRMCIYTFGNDCNEDNKLIDFTSDKTKLKEVLQEVGPTDDQTQLYTALEKAVRVGQRLDENLPVRRVVVVLTDGKDEGSGLNAGDIKKQILEYHLPIYAIGYSRLRSPDKEKYLKVLKNLSTISGGVYLEAKENNLQEIYQTLLNAIHRVYRLDLTCEKCEADGRFYLLNVNLTTGSMVLSDHMDIRLIPVKKTITPKKWPLWVYLAGGMGLLLLVFILLLVIKKHKKPEPNENKSSINIEDDKPETFQQESAELSPPEKPGITIRLVEIGGKGKKNEYETVVREKITIGRNEDCDIVIKEDIKLSRQHSELLHENDNILIRDLDTINGTAVNGVPINGRFRLESGDKILLGDTELRILF